MKVHELPFIEAVTQNNGKIFQVGGAVRDQFLGKESKDLDIVITGIPIDHLQGLLSLYGRVDLVGASFGIIKFKPQGSKDDIDIALPRTERKISIGHKGFDVNADHNLPIETDLERRDFTINSIAQDLDGNIIDPFGGLQDLRDRVIKLTNPAAFSDDPLRMLRAVQFASRFDFDLDLETHRMIKDHAGLITEISGERILTELEKMVHKGKPEVATKLLFETQLYTHIFGTHFAAAVPEVMKRVTRVSEFIFLLLFHSGREPGVFFRKHLKGDEATTREIQAFYRAKLTLEKKVNIFEARELVVQINKTAPAVLNSFIIRDMFELGVVIDAMKRTRMPFSMKEMVVTGDHLIAVGYHEGQEVGRALHTAFKGILHGVINNTYGGIMKALQDEQKLCDEITSIKKFS